MSQPISRIEDLKPWMRGPFELIRHADGHLRDKGDTDRRIALIGFDNAIEVSVDVFLRLHPKLRGGLEIARAEVEAAQRNYHTKIEFLDKHVQAKQISLSIRVDEIVWFHQLRNELYHSGNGMVPEEHVIHAARGAALAVFEALFAQNISRLLPEGGVSKPASVVGLPKQTGNAEMEFLQWFIDLEQELRKALPTGNAQPMPLRQMWQVLSAQRADLREFDSAVNELMRTRNAIVHGQSSPTKDGTELNTHLETILEILDRLHRGPKQ